MKRITLALFVAAIGLSTAHAAPVCNTSTQAAGNTTHTITHGGISRTYRLHVPAQPRDTRLGGAEPARPFQLVVGAAERAAAGTPSPTARATWSWPTPTA